MSEEKQRCNICKMFDCGSKCQCECHYGATPKIRDDLDSEDARQTQKTEEASMEGLSSLFG